MKKYYAMKKLFIFVFLPFLMMACSSTKESNSSNAELVKNAVESRKYIIKLDRLYSGHGAMVDLVPRANYIIIDGEKAMISAAYFGRQYGGRPISAINMKGRAEAYEAVSKQSKGSYDIKLRVNGGANSFLVYLTVTKSGNCNASVSSLKIENTRYSGHLVPIPEKYPEPEQALPDEGNMI
jgi:hypothetical protein